MTTSIPLRVFIFTSALKKTSEKGENWWRELRDIYFSMIAEKPHKIKVFQRWASKKGIRFRVLHLRPLGQLSVYVIPYFFQKLLERTDGKNNKIFNFRTGENPWFYGLFKRSKQPTLQKISSQPRYDHFDTSPWTLPFGTLTILSKSGAFVKNIFLKIGFFLIFCLHLAGLWRQRVGFTRILQNRGNRFCKKLINFKL